MFGALTSLRDRPLPDLAFLRAVWEDHRPWPIKEAPGAARLVPASDYGLRGRNFYAHARNPPYWHSVPGSIPDLLVRPEVGEKLAQIDARLAQDGDRRGA